MTFTPPKLAVVSITSDAEGLLTQLRGDASTYAAPLAPAGLYDLETQRVEALQLHKLVQATDETYIFRTYGPAVQGSGLLGSTFVFRPWWTPRAWKLVTDTTLMWKHSRYPSDGTHALCELTYASIGAGEENLEGYYTGPWWVTVEAYKRFIEADEYHCRDDA